MKLSIIVPVYNCDKWIVSKIDELLQLVVEIKESEIILVDDCNNDDTARYIYHDDESAVSVLKDGYRIIRDFLIIFINSDKGIGEL